MHANRKDTSGPGGGSEERAFQIVHAARSVQVGVDIPLQGMVRRHLVVLAVLFLEACTVAMSRSTECAISE